MAAKSSPKTAGAIFGARQRSSSSGSIRSIGPTLSIDLEDRLDGGGFLSALSSDDIVIRLQSTELVEDILLPGNTAAASAALEAERPSATRTNNGALPSKQQVGDIAKLASHMEKLNTSDEIALLDEKFWISSGEWCLDYDIKPANSVDMHPSMLWDVDSHLSPADSGNVAVSQHSKSPTRNPRDSFSGPPESPPLALAPFKSSPECHTAKTPLSQKPEACLGLMHSSSSKNTNLMSFARPPRSSPLALAPFKSPPECQAATKPLSQKTETCLGLMHSSSSKNTNPMSFSGPPQSRPLAIAPLKSPPECQSATTPLSQKPETCLGLMHSSSSRKNPMRNSLVMCPPLNSNLEVKACEDSKLSIPSSPKPPLKNLKRKKKTASSTTGKKRMPTGKKKKERRPRQLDMTHAVKMTDHDILFGKGGKINKHPGNVYFRDKAIKFLPWYMQSSKEEKEKIADVLLESVENEGRRFLEKKNGSWYKVIRGQHIKAGATLRDLKGRMKESG